MTSRNLGEHKNFVPKPLYILSTNNFFMIRFAFSPQWFFGIDSFFEFLSLAIIALISIYCYWCYVKWDAPKSYQFMSYAFLAMVLGFFFKIMTNITVVYENITHQEVGPLLLTITSVKQSDIFLLVGTSLFYFLFLLGLLIVFLVVYKQYDKHTTLLLLYFIAIITFFSQYSYLVFYLTTTTLLGLIFNKYWKNFLKKKSKNSLLLALSFFTLIISHLIFVFVFVNLQLYVVAETLQLFGFILLLLTFISVIKK
jgi:hypothetical protein